MKILFLGRYTVLAGDISEDLNLQPFYLSSLTHCKPRETQYSYTQYARYEFEELWQEVLIE